MGSIVNLVSSWEPYKAAKNALANTLQTSNVKEVSIRMGESLKVRFSQIDGSFFQRVEF